MEFDLVRDEDGKQLVFSKTVEMNLYDKTLFLGIRWLGMHRAYKEAIYNLTGNPDGIYSRKDVMAMFKTFFPIYQYKSGRTYIITFRDESLYKEISVPRMAIIRRENVEFA